MTLTRRGRVVAGGGVLGLIWGVGFGIPALNVVVLPGAIALVAGWLLVSRAEPPSVNRAPVDADFPGNERLVEIDVAHPTAVAVEGDDAVPDGARVATGSADRPVVDGSMAYEVAADQRGVVTLGPVEVRYRDPLGLFVRRFEIDETVALVTYPAVRPLDWWAARSALRSEGTQTRERHVFDRLREYDQGDPLRDIHWRSSAKRGEHDFIVKEFAADSERGALRIVGESEVGCDDEMAAALASVALWLLDDGIPIGLEVADASLPVAGGPPQRRRILASLARTSGGRVDPETHRGAPVRVLADRQNGVTIEIGDRGVDFEEIVQRPGATRSGLRIAADGGRDP